MSLLSRYIFKHKQFYYQPMFFIYRGAKSGKPEKPDIVKPSRPCEPCEEIEEDDYQIKSILPNKIKLAIMPYQKPNDEDHDAYNMSVNRPMSPHLTIYAIQLQSTLSITHRITGAVIGVYTLLFSLITLMLSCPIEYYVDSLEDMNMSFALTFIIKLILAYPFCYHFWNGIRHLLWDVIAGKLLTIQGVFSTGYAMLAVSAVSALILSW